MKELKILGIVIGVLFVTLISVTIIVNHKVTEAHERGDSEGYAHGYKVGYEVGREDGQAQGYEVGYELGREDGQAQGYVVGYEAGHNDGYKVGGEEGYDSGYQVGFDEGIGSDYLVRNPTYKEVQEILDEDKTHSAWEINNNAEDKGIRAIYVVVSLSDGWIYELVAFETIGKGLILVDPWVRQEVKVEIGKRYSELNGFPLPDWDDTITKITIIW